MMVYSNPIYIIGAGGIVDAAHLPAYQLAQFSVLGIYDLDISKAKKLAEKFGIKSVFTMLQDLVQAAPNNAIFDIAVPANEIIAILKELPDGAFVLIQKPVGENLQMAQQIVKICKEKNIVAGINFQLRYAPFIIEAKNILTQLGAINSIEVYVNVYTPWHLWPFLKEAKRVEILYHSIHYIDLIKTFLGLPNTIFAKTTKHSAMNNIASVRSNIIMDYGENIQASIHTNHCHNYGREKQQSYIKLECDKGAIMINFGVLIDYPVGVADSMEYINTIDRNEWQKVELNGTWFPHAFIGSMEEMLKAANDSGFKPDNHINSALETMLCVEAAYASNSQGGVSINKLINE